MAESKAVKMMDSILEGESHVHVNVLVKDNAIGQNRPPPPITYCQHVRGRQARSIIEPIESHGEMWRLLNTVKMKPVILKKLDVIIMDSAANPFCISIPNNKRRSNTKKKLKEQAKESKKKAKESEEKAARMLSVAKEQVT